MPINTHSACSAYGKLAQIYTGRELPIHVLRSANGFYIGTTENNEPVSRESIEYFSSHFDAETAMKNGTWSQRTTP